MSTHTRSIEAATNTIADRGNNDDHIVHIDKWVESLTKILEDVPHYVCSPGHPGRISRVPENLRELDVKAYEPFFLSIGPYHHGKPGVQKMEKRKWMILKSFLERKPEVTLQDYLNEIKSIETVARSFYSDVKMDREEFLQMLLLDSLYIITLFCGRPNGHDRMNKTNSTSMSRVDNQDIIETGSRDNANENTQVVARADEPNNQKSKKNTMPRWSWILIQHDLFLLENQLPFFVLKKIFSLIYGGPETQLQDIMKHKVGNMLLNYTKVDSEIVISQAENVHHLLHLGHFFFRPTLQQGSSASQLHKSNQQFRLGSAVQLYEAGVNFEAKSCLAKYSLLDITFESSGKMLIPCLCFDDNTVSLLRNLIALEQMKYPSVGLDVSAYIVLLLHLVTIPADVKLLRSKGIIHHHLASDKDMVYLVNRLSVGLAFDYVEDDYSLKHVFQELKSYSERRAPRWRAWLKHKYFNNPWTTISLMAASLLILLSALQTYYTVYSYYKPNFNGHS